MRAAQVEVAREASGIFSFGDREDWMVLTKLLDGCDFTDGLWLMHSVTYATPGAVDLDSPGDVQGNHGVLPLWSLEYRDTVTGEVMRYDSFPEQDQPRSLQERATVNRRAFTSACSPAHSDAFSVKTVPAVPGVPAPFPSRRSPVREKSVGPDQRCVCTTAGSRSRSTGRHGMIRHEERDPTLFRTVRILQRPSGSIMKTTSRSLSRYPISATSLGLLTRGTTPFRCPARRWTGSRSG